MAGEGSRGNRSAGVGRRRLGAALALLAGLATLAAGTDSQQERRNRIGQRLFRTLLAADLDLAAHALPDGRLPVAFFYTDDREQAAEQLEGFARRDEDGEPEPVKDLALALRVTDDPTFPEWGDHPPAGIFLTQDPGEEVLDRIVRYGIEHRVIVYSPYEGHVERGVLGGLSVGAQLRVYLNVETLETSGIHLKAFFLELARLHP